MCLGSEARAANKAARRQYQYQLQGRERNWMNTVALENVKRVQYDQTLDALHVNLGNVYADIQEKYRDQIGAARQEQEQLFVEHLENSEYAKVAASGQTGRSIDRMATVEFGKYLAESSRKAYQLTQVRRELTRAGAKAAGETRAAQLQAFAQNNIIQSPDIAPPRPVMRNVGAAAFMDLLKIGSSVGTIALPFVALAAGSDRRLKENIKQIGKSITGLGIYKFNYIGKTQKYIGTMADEVMKVVPEAVVTMPNGFLGVNYDLIDVTFKEA